MILGRDGQVLGANLPGEVALRGPSVFSGYGGGGPAAEAANLEAFEGGWFHTGDEVGPGSGAGTLQGLPKCWVVVTAGSRAGTCTHKLFIAHPGLAAAPAAAHAGSAPSST